MLKKKTVLNELYYSLVHLAGIEPVRVASLDPKSSASASSAIGAWCRLSESNQQPDDYKSTALPIELRRHNERSFKRLFILIGSYIKYNALLFEIFLSKDECS